MVLFFSPWSLLCFLSLCFLPEGFASAPKEQQVSFTSAPVPSLPPSSTPPFLSSVSPWGATPGLSTASQRRKTTHLTKLALRWCEWLQCVDRREEERDWSQWGVVPGCCPWCWKSHLQPLPSQIKLISRCDVLWCFQISARFHSRGACWIFFFHSIQGNKIKLGLSWYLTNWDRKYCDNQDNWKPPDGTKANLKNGNHR